MNSIACVSWVIGTIITHEWLTSVGEFMTGVGGLATATVVFVFGILGLNQYKEGLRHYREAQRLKAAEMLLEMRKNIERYCQFALNSNCREATNP